MFPQEVESSVGDTIVLVSDEGKALQFEQYVRITKLKHVLRLWWLIEETWNTNIATYTINDPLERDFVGLTARLVVRWNTQSKTIIRESIVADTGEDCASVKIGIGCTSG